jgi:hypothetical protein
MCGERKLYSTSNIRRHTLHTVVVDEFWPKTTLYLVVFPCVQYSIRGVSQDVGFFL